MIYKHCDGCHYPKPAAEVGRCKCGKQFCVNCGIAHLAKENCYGERATTGMLQRVGALFKQWDRKRLEKRGGRIVI